jgi:hypothetical protein
MNDIDETPITLPPGANVSFSQRLFSEEVAMANAAGGIVEGEPNPVYVFSNGRKFYEPPS